MRSMLVLAGIGLLAFSAGCSMCAHPYDQCGPSIANGNPMACVPGARAGSIFSPMQQEAAYAPAGEAAVPTPAVPPGAETIAPGQVIETPTTPAEPAVAPQQPKTPIEPAPAPPVAPSDRLGWRPVGSR